MRQGIFIIYERKINISVLACGCVSDVKTNKMETDISHESKAPNTAEYMNRLYERNKRSIKITSIIIAIALSFIGLPALWLEEVLMRAVMESVFWMFVGIITAFTVYIISSSLVPIAVKISSTEIVFIHFFKERRYEWKNITEIKTKRGGPDLFLPDKWQELSLSLKNGKRQLLPVYLSEELAVKIVNYWENR